MKIEEIFRFTIPHTERLQASFLKYAKEVKKTMTALEVVNRGLARFDSSSTFKEHYRIKKNSLRRAIDLTWRLTNRSTTRGGTPIKVISVDWNREGDVVITYSMVATKTPNMHGVVLSYFYHPHVTNLKYIIKRLRYHR
jgi:hypothetical protein